MDGLIPILTPLSCLLNRNLGLGIVELQFFGEKKYLIIFSAVFLVIKTLDPDSLKMLDPDPDAQHWL
jgi:hypothetical protein